MGRTPVCLNRVSMFASSEEWMHAARAGVTAALCGALALTSMPASAAASVKAKKAAVADAATQKVVAKPLDVAARERLMLSRFTFGPSATDEAEVKRLGVDRWLDRQLNPLSIDDAAFESRLDVYPALRMAQADRLKRYPEPATLRVMARTGVLPEDPELHAILADQVEFYQMRRENQAAAAQKAAPAMQVASMDVPTGTTSMDIPSSAGGAPIVRQTVIKRTATQMNQTAPSAGSAGAAMKPAMPLQGANDAAAVNLEQSTQPMAKPQMEAILAMDPTNRYGRLLSMPPAELIALRKAARGPQLEGKLVDGMTPLQKETLLALSGTNRMINAETQNARLLRDIYSERQVEAVMTDFWLNHFNVFSGANGQIPSMLPEYEKTVRAHALGKFEDLLVATAQSPAMLLYLNNSTSVGPDSIAAVRANKNARAKKQDLGLNENYGRELMELHTLGVTGGYTQKDVTEVAKVFTGWTLERPYEGGSYTFNANRHEPGSKTVLGKTIHEGGEKEGLEVLHMLATSPATAHFISTEIAQRFVSDAPPAAMVDRMAKAYLSSDGDVKAVLRAMVKSPEFFTTATVNAKLKTPLEYVTSAVRASGADVVNPLPLVQSLQQLGMPLYGCQPPTGYKWDESTWLSSSALIARMNFALTLSTNRVAGATVDWTPVLSTGTGFKTVALTADASDDAKKESLLEAKLFEVPVSEQTRAAVISQGNDATAQQAAAQFNGSGGQRQLTDAEKQAQEQDRLDAMMAGRVKGEKPLKGAAVQQARAIGAVPAKMGPAPADKNAAAMAGLLLGSPEFQRR